MLFALGICKDTTDANKQDDKSLKGAERVEHFHTLDTAISAAQSTWDNEEEQSEAFSPAISLAKLTSLGVKELVAGVEAILLNRSTVEDLLKTYQSRLSSLDNIIKNLGEVTLTKKSAPELLRFDASVENTLDSLYDYHERKSVELHARIRRAQVDIRDMDEQLQKLRVQISKLRNSNNVKRSICITLETIADITTAEIVLTYQVNDAYWTPSYDIRVQTTTASAQLKLLYFGNICQSSGEDWQDVELILSTAQPQIGGQLPQIGTLQAQLRKPLPPPPPMHVHKRMFGAPAIFGAAPATFGAEPPPPEMAVAADLAYVAHQAESHALSTTFAVPQSKTIPSDGSDHKVTIVQLELRPLLGFNCVPKKSTNVYLTASMINSSAYPLLKGVASVYVDNSFSTRIPIKSVSTGEKFDLALGVDPTVKLVYKPLHTFQQQSGLLSKTSLTINEQIICVKNTKADEPIVLTMLEHVPKSTDEKIRASGETFGGRDHLRFKIIMRIITKA